MQHGISSMIVLVFLITFVVIFKLNYSWLKVTSYNIQNYSLH